MYIKNKLPFLQLPLIVFLPLLLWAQPKNKKPLTVTINEKNKAQIINNFGASGCWFSENIGKYWPAAKKERIAEMLFSRQFDVYGNPKGIGLSAWRFNIGGGTAEQGDSSGIVNPLKRVESFLAPDGTYSWSKQAGYQWFLQQAKKYGVENLIAFSNTPPVQFNQNGLGFKLVKDYQANLKPDNYAAYAGFLTQVIKHFEKVGLPFTYISPVNEPQWDWSNEFGKMNQEGSPWANKDIYNVVQALDSALVANKLKTQILTPEAGMLTYLYGGNTAASKQVQHFFSTTSELNIGKLQQVPNIIAGHSYFTDAGDSAMIAVRQQLNDTVQKYGVDFWQSEYSMLGNGYKEGNKGRRSAMDCALFLAKVIHQDLTVANAKAWQYWNAYEPGSTDWETRYYLIALQPNATHTDGSFSDTKNLWALGHYSLFIRPGMQRLQVQRSDNATAIAAAQQVMVSAFTNQKGKMVVIAINYTQEEQPLHLNLANTTVKTVKSYTTTAAATDNMKAAVVKNINEGVMLPARSITTFVINE